MPAFDPDLSAEVADLIEHSKQAWAALGRVAKRVEGLAPVGAVAFVALATVAVVTKNKLGK